MSSVCLFGQPAGQPFILHDKNFDVEHNTTKCSTSFFFFLAAMLIGTIDFCHFIPLSMALTLAGSHKVSTKQNLLASFSPTLLI